MEYTIHFSIDDVINSFRWMYRNQPVSIFDMNFYGTLLKWHLRYGLKVSLYIFNEDGHGFTLEQLPAKYLDELRENQDWIHAGYHGIYSEGGFIKNECRFENEQKRVSGAFHDMLAETVRLHCWNASENNLRAAHKYGNVKSVLAPMEPTECFETLSEEDKRLIFRGDPLLRDGILFQKTDYRLDNLTERNKIAESILAAPGKIQYIFLHEWSFQKNTEAISFLWETLLQNGRVKFVL